MSLANNWRFAAKYFDNHSLVFVSGMYNNNKGGTFTDYSRLQYVIVYVNLGVSDRE